MHKIPSRISSENLRAPLWRPEKTTKEGKRIEEETTCNARETSKHQQEPWHPAGRAWNETATDCRSPPNQSSTEPQALTAQTNSGGNQLLIETAYVWCSLITHEIRTTYAETS